MRDLTVFNALRTGLRVRAPNGLSSVDGRGWSNLWSSGSVGDWEPGSWQRDQRLPLDKSLAFFAVYACITQIASDIAKLCLYLKLRNPATGIWEDTENPAFSPFLRKPNHFQTTQQFIESWEISKLSRGNALILKERDERNVVIREYVLDWDRATPLVAPDGSVFYQLMEDDLSHLPFSAPAVPASEVIHDRMNCLFHPLVGISPLFACGLAARQGLEIQSNSAQFFANMSRPSGVLTAPTRISDELAARLKKEWETNFGRGKIGKVAVLGDAMKYEPMATTPVDSALVDQLKISALMVCSAFGVPPWKIGIEPQPPGKPQDLNQNYYSDCLQSLIKAFEDCQSAGLGLKPDMRVCFDLDDLLLMDTKTLAEVQGILAQRGISKINESRAKFNLPPVKGGDTPYLQQQNFSLSALDERDTGDDPFGKAKPPAPEPTPPNEDDPPPNDAEKAATAELERLRWIRGLERRFAATTAR